MHPFKTEGLQIPKISEEIKKRLWMEFGPLSLASIDETGRPIEIALTPEHLPIMIAFGLNGVPVMHGLCRRYLELSEEAKVVDFPISLEKSGAA